MDTFMDKLAQRFTAQELIKANSAAEIEEMNRLKAQVDEYTHCLNRMQQICAEMEQSAEAARGRMDSVQLNTDDLKAQLLEIRREMQNLGNIGNAGGGSDLAEVFEKMSAAQESRLEMMQGEQQTQFESLRGSVESQLSAIKSAQETQLNSAKALQEEQLETIRVLQETQLEGLRGMQENQFDAMKNALDDQLDSVRSMIKAQISNIKNGQDGQLDGLKSALELQNTTLETQLADMKSVLETQLSGANEFVHKECVKVYRNVQAVVGEENNKQSENFEFTVKPMGKKLKSVFSISIAALVVSIISVALQVLSLLHIF